MVGRKHENDRLVELLHKLYIYYPMDENWFWNKHVITEMLATAKELKSVIKHIRKSHRKVKGLYSDVSSPLKSLISTLKVMERKSFDSHSQKFETIRVDVIMEKTIILLPVVDQKVLSPGMRSGMSEEEKRAAEHLAQEKTRTEGFSHLRENGTAVSASLVEPHLLSGNEGEVIHALQIIGNIGSIKSIPLVERLLYSHSNKVRWEALLCLASLEPFQILDTIKRYLPAPEDEAENEFQVRLMSATIKSDDKRLLSFFKEYVEHYDSDIVYYARLGLFKLTGDMRYHDIFLSGGNDILKSKKLGKGLGRIRKQRLDKDGKERLYVLGGKDRGKFALRKISEGAFLAWKHALESVSVWKRHGFDYVPVEPMGSFKRTWKGDYLVSAPILGPNLNSVLISQHNSKLTRRLKKDKERIISIMKEIGVHDDNVDDADFCVDVEKGRLRLYYIDFDHARLE